MTGFGWGWGVMDRSRIMTTVVRCMISKISRIFARCRWMKSSSDLLFVGKIVGAGLDREFTKNKKTHSRFCQFDMEKNTVKTDLLLKDLKVAITSVATFRNFVYVSGWGDKLLVYTLRRGDSIEYPINL